MGVTTTHGRSKISIRKTKKEGSRRPQGVKKKRSILAGEIPPRESGHLTPSGRGKVAGPMLPDRKTGRAEFQISIEKEYLPALPPRGKEPRVRHAPPAERNENVNCMIVAPSQMVANSTTGAGLITGKGKAAERKAYHMERA